MDLSGQSTGDIGARQQLILSSPSSVEDANTRADQGSITPLDSPNLPADRLALMLGQWTDGADPLHRSLAKALGMLIDSGQLPAMTRLPSERVLARALAVGRNTVVAAYDILRSADVISSRLGSGTWVNLGDTSSRWADDNPAFPWRHRVAPVIFPDERKVPALIDLSAVSLAPLPAAQEVMMRLGARDWRAAFSSRGYFPLGIAPLRGAIADDYGDQGIETDPDGIIVTSGAQQALELTAAAIIQPGEGVALEDPTYPGALSIFRKAGASLFPIPMDEEGMRPEGLREALDGGTVRLIYINPTFQNPCGLIMSDSRRRELVGLANAAGAVVVETTAWADLSFGAEKVPRHVAAYENGGSVVTLGSMSSLYWSGLRVGWIRASGQLLSQLGRLKALADLGNPLLEQMFALRLLERADELKLTRRRELSERCDFLTALLKQKLPEWRWRTPSGGASLWIHLPEGSASEFAQVALRHLVLILPGSVFSAGGAWDNHFRLPFVLEKSGLEMAIDYLAVAWKDHIGRAKPFGTEKKP